MAVTNWQLTSIGSTNRTKNWEDDSDIWENSSTKFYFSADTPWTFTGIGAIGVTGYWNLLSDAIDDLWENSSTKFAHAAGTSWAVTSLTGKAIARDSD